MYIVNAMYLQRKETALLLAVLAGHQEIVKVLLQAKSDVNHQDYVSRCQHVVTICWTCMYYGTFYGFCIELVTQDMYHPLLILESFSLFMSSNCVCPSSAKERPS